MAHKKSGGSSRNGRDSAGKELISELYEKYLDKPKTVSVWSERIEP